MLFHIDFQIGSFLRQQERYWSKAKFLIERFTHAIGDAAEDLFSCHVLQHWVTIVPKLILAHAFVILVVERQRKPVQVSTDCGFLKTVFEDDMLQQFKFRFAITCVDHKDSWSIGNFLVFPFHYKGLLYDGFGDLLLLFFFVVACSFRFLVIVAS